MITLPLEHILMVVFAAGALALCARMLRGGRRLPGCGAGSGCEAVLASRWARWGPLPVALPALAAYLAALLASLLAMWAGPPALARAAGITLLELAPVFAGAAAWFALLQLLAVRRMCGYCLAIHAAGAAVAVLAVAAARGRGIEWAAVVGWMTPGWVALAAFVAGHVLLRPRMHEVQAAQEARNPKHEIRNKLKARNSNDGNGGAGVETPVRREAPSAREARNSKHEIRNKFEARNSNEGNESVATPNLPVPAAPQNSFEFPGFDHLNLFRASSFGFRASGAASRRIRAFGGRVDLAVNEWPVLGMPGAPNVAVFLFDYTCRECRHMRRLIAQAMDRHPAKLAVLLVPIPMDPRVLGTDTTANGMQITDNRPDAIGYVRLAWALWRADPLAYVRFDNWLSAPTCAPPLRDAVAAARKLAPSADLNTAGRSELSRFIDQRIARAVAIYRALGDQPVPALLFPGTALRGHVETADELTRIIEREMRIGREPARPRPSSAPGRLPVGA